MRNSYKTRKKSMKNGTKKMSFLRSFPPGLRLQESTPFNVLFRFLKFQHLATHIEKVMTS